MNDRIVVRVLHGVQGTELLFLDKGPVQDVAIEATPLILDLQAPPWPSFLQAIGAAVPQMVKLVGQQLYDLLVLNGAVKRVLDAALTALATDSRPIYVHIQSDWADGLPWETLYEKQKQFLTLDSRWPIGRMAGIPVPSRSAIQRFFDPPLRILAVLTAARCSAREQWNALREALNILGVAWEVTLLLCESELLQEVIAAGEHNVHAALVRDKDHLLATMDQVRPQIVHFFCHGRAGQVSPGGTVAMMEPTLQFANRIDWELDAETGSISVEARDLYTRKALQDYLWLLTLNCCQGATSREGVLSIARALVQSQLPAVVGMRERVVPADAHAFCKAFYRSVFAEIAGAQAQAGGPADVEWVRALQQPRQAAAGGVACDEKKWTFPVLYVRPEPFQLRAAPPGSTLTAEERQKLEEELKKLKEGRANLSTLLPPAALERLDARIRELGQALYLADKPATGAEKS